MAAQSYGLIATFDNAPDLYHAAEKIRDAGYRNWDCITPFPVHGLDKAMGLKRSIVPRISLCGGILGFTPLQRIPVPEEGSTRIRDIGWRSPTSVSVLSDINGDFAQIRTFSVDGSPGEIEVSGLTRLRGPIRTLVSAPVDVTLVSAQAHDVLSVPVAALVALAEGGYGVQVVEGSSTRYVAVKTGMFASGRVEITGDGIAEGTLVEVPK